MLLALLLAFTGTPADLVDPRLPHRLEKANVGRDGASAATAYKVDSVAEEYQIARKLGVRTHAQALIEQDGRMFDKLLGTDAEGRERELWFDISSFYGEAARAIRKARK